MADAGGVEIGERVVVDLLSEVHRVVIGGRGELHAAERENVRRRLRREERERGAGPGAEIGDAALKIYDRHIVVRRHVEHVGEGVRPCLLYTSMVFSSFI